MRSIVGITIALFVGVLLTAFVAAEQAHPVFINVDPASVISLPAASVTQP